MKNTLKLLAVTALLLFVAIVGYFTLEYLSKQTIYIKGDIS